MLKKVLLTLLALLVILLLIGAMLSQRYEVSRSVVVKAPTERIYPLIAQLENWPQWNPFIEIDPTIGTAERLEQLLREAHVSPADDDDE